MSILDYAFEVWELANEKQERNRAYVRKKNFAHEYNNIATSTS